VRTRTPTGWTPAIGRVMVAPLYPTKGRFMLKAGLVAATFALAPIASHAAVRPFPADFHTLEVKTADGATIHVRYGGSGPAVLMLHGFGDSGDMWAPLAAIMAKDHMVIVPDLRGMGLSSHPATGYTKKNQAADVAQVLAALHVTNLDLVTHDIGNMVGYAFAVQHGAQVRRWVVMDAPLPGIGHWDDQLKNPKTWHFNFYGPDVERLVAGRERILLDRFYNDLSADPARIDEATRQHYALLYARPQAIHDALEQFHAFPLDAVDNQQLFATYGKLTMPVLAIGGSASYGDKLAVELGFVANNVQAQVIAGSGHWLMEEQPVATMAAIRDFLAKP
jgi:pimeloyl-ACP methyl ester carboxylesterase